MKTSLAKNTRAGNQTSVKKDSTFVKCALACKVRERSHIRFKVEIREWFSSEFLLEKKGDSIYLKWGNAFTFDPPHFACASETRPSTGVEASAPD